MSAAGDLRRTPAERHGVADVRTAARLGVAPHEFYRGTRGDGWRAPFPGVRVDASRPRTIQQDLIAVAAATRNLAAASGVTASWLLGTRQRPIRPATFVVAHGTDMRLSGTSGGRARWLAHGDVEVVDQVPTLTGPAVAVSPHGRQRRSCEPC